MQFFLRWLGTSLAVGVANMIVPGIALDGSMQTWVALALIGLVLSIVDLTIKPILQILSLPISILTLGVFYLIVNTIVLYIAQAFANGLFEVGFEISSFGSAFIASIVISIVSSIIDGATGVTR